MEKKLLDFRRIVYRYYKRNGRSLPWRLTRDPYRILVSEIMLQQTQVKRVIGKYESFVAALPDFESLHRAPLKRVLVLWQGLGYNRRALALKRIARVVVIEHKGIVPRTVEGLEKLPGIGRATACAVLAFAFNKPVAFIETNVRSAFIHHFFPRRKNVRDAEIAPLVAKTLDAKNPRVWYWALMDYGAMLKRKYRNPNRKSAHYVRQSRFEGSRRQLRGKILRQLAQRPRTCFRLAHDLSVTLDIVTQLLRELKAEGFIALRGKRYTIA